MPVKMGYGRHKGETRFMSQNEKNEPRQDQPIRNDLRNTTRFVVVGFPRMAILQHSRVMQVGLDTLYHPAVVINARSYRSDGRQQIVDLTSCACIKLDPRDDQYKWTVTKVRDYFLNYPVYPSGPTYEKATAKYRTVLQTPDKKPIEFAVPMLMTEEFFMKVVIARELEEIEKSKKTASIDLTTALLGVASA
jgi:hypothetical protein